MMTATHGIDQRATSGVLVHPGPRTVWLMFYIRPLPTELPAEVQYLAEPVHGRDGQVVDWQFGPRPGPDEQLVTPTEAFETYRRWRAQWANERAVGDAATVWAFVDWAERHIRAPRLPVLRSRLGHVDPKHVPELGWEAKLAAAACRRSSELGVAVVAQSTGRVIRGFVPAGSAVSVLAHSAAQVDATLDGLLLSQHGPIILDQVRVQGWHTSDGGIIVTTPNGDIDLGQTPAARLLEQVAAASAAVSVQPIPLTRLFSYLTASVAEIAQLASVARQTLYIRTSEI